MSGPRKARMVCLDFVGNVGRESGPKRSIRETYLLAGPAVYRISSGLRRSGSVSPTVISLGRAVVVVGHIASYTWRSVSITQLILPGELTRLARDRGFGRHSSRSVSYSAS